MIRKLLATTAIATLIASGAYAQDATTPSPAVSAPAADTATVAPVTRADGSLVTNIIGESVYNGTGDDAESIGKVTDLVFDKDGQTKSAIIGVGGFLGLGDKNVAFDYGKLQWAEKNGDRWLVAQTSKDELTKQPEFDTKPYEPASAQSAANTTLAPADATAPAATTLAPAGSTASSADTKLAPSGEAAPGNTTLAPATADNTAPADTGAPAPAVAKADGNLASNILGETVYNGSGADAQNIGDINDVVIAKDGKAQSLIIGVGGFLGIGEKSVAYDFGKAQWAEKDGDRWLVVQTTKEELQKLPDFDRKAYDPAPATTAANDVTSPAPMAASPADATAPAATDTAQNATPPAATAPAADATDSTQTAAIDKSTLTEMPVGQIRSEDLVGTTVYGANDAKVGKIGDVVLAADQKVDSVIIDVGGFLGIGSKEVAVGMDNLKFMTDKDGNKYLYTSFTKEQLDAQAAYDKGSYAQKRDEQRMSVTQ